MEIVEMFGISGIPTVAIMCLCVGAIVKHGIKIIPNETIPVICMVFGAIISVIGFYIEPEFPANTLFNAAAMGIISGLSATGIHQAVHQVVKVTETSKK